MIMAEVTDRTLFNLRGNPHTNVEPYLTPPTSDYGGIGNLLRDTTEFLTKEREPPIKAVTDFLLGDSIPAQLLRETSNLVGDVKTPTGETISERAAKHAKEYMQAVAQDSSPTDLFSESTAATTPTATTSTAPGRTPTGIASVAPSGPPRPTRPDLSKFYKEQSFDEFAKQLGLDPKGQAYDPWDYIGDMSAALLASNNPRFLGALGEAALLSNKNRAAMEAAQNELREKLATAKYSSDQAWKQKAFDAEVDMYEADMDIYGDLLEGKEVDWKTDAAGSFTEIGADDVETIWEPVKEGASYVLRNFPSAMVRQVGNVIYLRKLKDDQAAAIDRNWEAYQTGSNKLSTMFDATDKMKANIDSWLMQTTAGGEFVISLKNIEGYDKIVEALRNGSEEAGIKLGELLEEGDPDAAEVARALAQLPQVFQQFKKLAISGPASNLENSAYSAITQRANEIADDELTKLTIGIPKGQRPRYNLGELRTKATKQAVDEINWDEENFQFKFRGRGATSAQIEAAQSASEDMRGIGWFNFAEAPAGYNKGYAPFHNPDERALLNLDQPELAKPEIRDEVYIDMANLHDLMVREGYDATQARWDINLSYDDSNLIYGGEDKPGWWKDSEATYKKPDTWYMEPKFYTLNGVQKPTSELRDKGIFWNGFKGEHYVFRNEIRKRADINAQPGAQIELPIPVRIN
jgi:hypothetical protein